MIHGLFDISVLFINYSDEQLILQVLLPCEPEKHMLVVAQLHFSIVVPYQEIMAF
jgi:hypothetical protein